MGKIRLLGGGLLTLGAIAFVGGRIFGDAPGSVQVVPSDDVAAANQAYVAATESAIAEIEQAPEVIRRDGRLHRRDQLLGARHEMAELAKNDLQRFTQQVANELLASAHDEYQQGGAHPVATIAQRCRQRGVGLEADLAEKGWHVFPANAENRQVGGAYLLDQWACYMALDQAANGQVTIPTDLVSISSVSENLGFFSALFTASVDRREPIQPLVSPSEVAQDDRSATPPILGD